MNKKQVLSKLNGSYSKIVAAEVYIFLMQDYHFFNPIYKGFVRFANNRIKEKNFDEVLFVQYVFNGLKLVTKEKVFAYHYYLRFDKFLDLSESTLYKVADMMSKQILDKYFRR